MVEHLLVSGTRWVGLVVVAASVLSAGARDYYCSPSADPQGNGTKESPWQLAKAIAPETTVRAGDTIWLMPGVYRGNFVSHLTGTAEHPIALRGVTAEQGAQIDGTGNTYPLTVRGAYTIYRDLEIVQSSTWNASAETPVAVQCHGSHLHLVNLVIHDAGQGIGAWMDAHDLEVYGCLIYHNGIRPLEHGIYTQNDAKTGTKRFVDNIIFNNSGFGIHAYTKGGQLSGFEFVGNVLFNNGTKRGAGEELDNLLVGGAPPADQIVARQNYCVFTGDTGRPNMHFSYGDHRTSPHGSLLVADNFLIGGNAFVAEDWQQITFTNNSVASAGNLVQIRPAPGHSTSDYVWNWNHYFGAAAFSIDGHVQHFTEWSRTSGLDQQSEFSAKIATKVQMEVRLNRYDSNRATVIVINWPLSNNVPVSVETLLQPGEGYEVRNAQDYFGAPVLKGKFDEQPLLLPMTNLSVALPKGPAPAPRPTGPLFNVFILQSTDAGKGIE